jgi:predicted MFS family arabinose efflux permease
VISVATGIRWIGWGMCEGLIPVFFFTYLHSYAAAGTFDAFGRIFFFLAFPAAGVLADRMSLKTFLLIGLLFFVGDSVGYVLTGLTGLVIFAGIANLLDGVAVVSDVIGRSTYVRRHGAREHASFLFGFMDAFVNAGWLLGMVLAYLLVDRLGMLWMFAAIGPTTLMTFVLYWVLLPREPARKRDRDEPAAVSFASYAEVWRQLRAWPGDLRLSTAAMLLVYTLRTIGTFLLPITLYARGAGLQQIILVGIVFNLPVLFGAGLGRIADRLRGVAAVSGLLGTGIALAVLALSSSFPVQLACVLALNVAIVLTGLAIEGRITRGVGQEAFGRVTAIFEAIKDLGGLIGPVFLGLAIDLAGVPAVFSACAALAAFLALALRRLSVRSRH